MRTFRSICLCTALLLAVSPLLPAGDAHADWLQYRGTNRDGLSAQTGLAEKWPEAGPKKVWEKPLGAGYSTVVAQGDLIFPMFANEEGEFITAMKAATGEEVWRVKVGALFEDQFGNGPRPTPSIDGDRVYAIGSDIVLFALDTATGEQAWAVDMIKEFGARKPRFGFSPSPLVDGDLLIIEAGGSEGNGVVALDKKSGKTKWTALDIAPGYSSPIAVTLGGVRQYIFVPSADQKIVSLGQDGAVLWTHEWARGNIAMPIQVAEDTLFVSSSDDVGAVLLKVGRKGEEFQLEEVWRNREMKNHFSSSVVYDGHIYGFDGATLKCLSAATGERKWAKRGFGKGSLIIADGLLIILGDRGQLVLAKASPEAWDERGRMQVLTGKTWATPTTAGGKLYLRDHEKLLCFDLKA